MSEHRRKTGLGTRPAQPPPTKPREVLLKDGNTSLRGAGKGAPCAGSPHRLFFIIKAARDPIRSLLGEDVHSDGESLPLSSRAMLPGVRERGEPRRGGLRGHQGMWGVGGRHCVPCPHSTLGLPPQTPDSLH